MWMIGQKYKLIREIGRGGSAAVWLAEDIRLHKSWAVKVLPKQQGTEGGHKAWFRGHLPPEAAIMTKLDHPALPRIVDVEEDSGHLYIVMDYIQGVSLETLLRNHGSFPNGMIQRWIGELCDVLSYLHHRNPPVIYRDLKPANILVQKNGHLKLVDFGISAEREDTERASASVGTRRYASPEQEAGRLTDARSDIYSLGVVLGMLLEGKRGESAPEQRQDVQDPVREGLRQIARRCMEPDPENRYQTCREIRKDLLHPERLAEESKKNVRSKNHAGSRKNAGLKKNFGSKKSVGSKRNVGSKKNSGLERNPGKKRKVFMCMAILAGCVTAAGFLCCFRFQNEWVKEEKQSEEDLRPLLLMTKNWQEEGVFTEEESARLTAIWNQKKNHWEEADPGYQELLYDTGMLYFYYYAGGDGSFRTRVRLAEPYLETCTWQDAESYQRICELCEEFLFSQPAKMDAKTYLAVLDRAEEILGTEDAGESAELIERQKGEKRLLVARLMVQIIQNERWAMRDAGCREKRILDHLDYLEVQEGELRPMIKNCRKLVREVYR